MLILRPPGSISDTHGWVGTLSDTDIVVSTSDTDDEPGDETAATATAVEAAVSSAVTATVAASAAGDAAQAEQEAESAAALASAAADVSTSEAVAAENAAASANHAAEQAEITLAGVMAAIDTLPDRIREALAQGQGEPETDSILEIDTAPEPVDQPPRRSRLVDFWFGKDS